VGPPPQTKIPPAKKLVVF